MLMPLRFHEQVICKRDSGVVQSAPSDRCFREQRDQEVQGGLKLFFRGSHSRGRARGRRARFSRLEEEYEKARLQVLNLNELRLSDFLHPQIEVIVDFTLVRVVLSSGFHDSENCVGVELGPLQEKLNCYHIKN